MKPPTVSEPIERANYIEVPEEVNVYSWSPAPPGTKDAKSTQVHLHLGKPPGNVVLVRFKGPRTLDALIEALQKHREDVWGAALSNPVSSRDAEGGESLSVKLAAAEAKAAALEKLLTAKEGWHLADLLHRIDAAEDKIEALEKERDEAKAGLAHWRGACVKAMVTGEYPVSSTDSDPDVVELRQAAEYAFHGEAYAAMSKCARAAEARVEALAGLLRFDKPWPLSEVLKKLADAAGHLLGQHSCDAHGYEEIGAAAGAARDILSRLADAALESPRPPAADECPSCGSRGLSTEKLNGACPFLECKDPLAWLKARELPEKGKEVVPSAPTASGSIRSDLSTGPTATPGAVGEVAPAAPARTEWERGRDAAVEHLRWMASLGETSQYIADVLRANAHRVAALVAPTQLPEAPPLIGNEVFRTEAEAAGLPEACPERGKSLLLHSGVCEPDTGGEAEKATALSEERVSGLRPTGIDPARERELQKALVEEVEHGVALSLKHLEPK